MKENHTHFKLLTEVVISELKALGYMDSTLNNYRTLYSRIGMFKKERSVEYYSPSVGECFIEKYYPIDTLTRRAVITKIRRLEDHMSNIPYRCHRAMKTNIITKEFEQLLGDYLNYCTDIGNKPGTIIPKRYFCLEFLNYLSATGCNDISTITAELVAKGCLIYKNKDGYAVMRQFLKYLFEREMIANDYSSIVPHFKHRQIIPSIYSPEEIRKMEDAFDRSTKTGKRNYAIFLLAARIGLRSGDIASLKYSEIDFERCHIDLIQEKTGEPLSVFIPTEVSCALKSHLNGSSGWLSDGYVFHSMHAPYGRLTTSIIRNIVSNCIISSKISVNERKHGPHALRSSLASSLVSNGASYDTVRRILGHSDPDTIKHYVKTDIERLRRCSLSPPLPTGNFLELLNGRRIF